MDADGDEVQQDPCGDVSRLIRRFLAGPLPVADERRLREHLAGCTQCQDLYQHAAHTAASVGRERREERLALERHRRHAEPDTGIFQGSQRPGPGQAHGELG